MHMYCHAQGPLLSCTQHPIKHFSIMHSEIVCLILLPVVHTACSNKCFACHAYNMPCRRPHLVMHIAFIANVFLSCTWALNTAMKGAHSIFLQMFSRSCIHQVMQKEPPLFFPAHIISANVPSHALSTSMPNTASSVAHSIFNKCWPAMHTLSPAKGLLMSCTQHIQHRPPASHTALVCLTLTPWCKMHFPTNVLPVMHK